MLDQLEAQGVGYVDTYCVDNALARVADPHFVGLADLKEADVCESLPHAIDSPKRTAFERGMADLKKPMCTIGCTLDFMV